MEKAWDIVVKSFEQDGALWVGCVIILMLTLAASHKSEPGWLAYRPKGYNRGKRMLRRARQEHVINLVTQEFVDSVEMKVYHGEITRTEATEVYRRMKQLFPIRNLFPSTELLKENIKKRLGKHIEPNLPGKVVKVRAKNLFDNSPKRVAL